MEIIVTPKGHLDDATFQAKSARITTGGCRIFFNKQEDSVKAELLLTKCDALYEVRISSAYGRYIKMRFCDVTIEIDVYV